MTHNRKRALRMAGRSVAELKRFVDAGSLSSAAAEYELRKRGIRDYPVTRERV
jgi:hypothetical protein